MSDIRVYIDMKTKLCSTSITARLRCGYKRWELVADESGEYILSLPDDWDISDKGEVLYEDAAIKIRR